MRGIERLKFRGWLKATDEWIVAPSPLYRLQDFFAMLDISNIDPATVGQWTGKSEDDFRGGCEIFAGDRVEGYCQEIDHTDEYGVNVRGVVEWDADELTWIIRQDADMAEKFIFSTVRLARCSEIEIIGNIHEVSKNTKGAR